MYYKLVYVISRLGVILEECLRRRLGYITYNGVDATNSHYTLD